MDDYITNLWDFNVGAIRKWCMTKTIRTYNSTTVNNAIISNTGVVINGYVGSN